jgi:hypothetical protein
MAIVTNPWVLQDSTMPPVDAKSGLDDSESASFCLDSFVMSLGEHSQIFLSKLG